MSRKQEERVRTIKTTNKDIIIVTLGELAVAAITVLGFFLADIAFDTGFSYRVFTGAILGCAVIVLNYLFLSLSVNRAVDNYLSERGKREMSDEEAERFTSEHSMAIQNSIKSSYITRTLTMLAALVLAFVLDWFNPLATVIPMLAFRPILMLGESIRRRGESAPDETKFISYDDDVSDKEEKESDE